MNARHAANGLKRGSASIFFCLVIMAAMVWMGIFLQASRLRLDETNLMRAMKAQIQTSLAAFDKNARDLGLFCFQAGSPDEALFYACFPNKKAVDKLLLIPENPLSDSLVLQRQIVRAMKCRVPAVLASQLLTRLSFFGDVFAGKHTSETGISKSRGGSPGSGGDLPDETRSLADLLQSFCGSLEGDDIQSAAGTIFDDLIKDAKNETAEKLEAIYRQYATEYLGVSEDDPFRAIGGLSPDFMDPASLSAAAGKLDFLLDFHTAPAYEKICLVEYILGQFRPSVDKMILDSGSCLLKTLDGRTFKSFPNMRTAEVETIITGKSDPGAAIRDVKFMVTGIRVIIHLASILSDSQMMASCKSTASILSAAVAVLSGGAVEIDPEVMVYLVVTGKSIDAGISDYKKLSAGNAVGLWPGRQQEILPLYYQDYLRLFLHLSKTKTLLDRTASQIGKLLPGSRYTSLRVQVRFMGKTVECSGGYDESPLSSDLR